jgi:hypothetical protein
MVMGVVNWVMGSHAGFMLAMAKHGCPAQLQGQQNQQKNGQVPFHD